MRVENESCSRNGIPEAGLRIDRLQVGFGHEAVVRDVSLTLARGSVHCLVGASGSGKTLTSLASVGLLPSGARASGAIHLSGTSGDLLNLDQRAWANIRGRSIGYVGQNALGCLHPAFTIGAQLVEAIRRHQALSKAEARTLALGELAAVDLAGPVRVFASYPGELSGGMCQRVALAMALCNRPSILIADEPTTALDDDTQEHILELVRSRVDQSGLGVLLITHDHDVVDRIADEITTIADGVTATTESAQSVSLAIAKTPRSPRVAVDSLDERRGIEPVLQIAGVEKTYGRSGRFRPTHAPVLRDVTISAQPGMTVGLVGPSGAGKTTLAQIVAGIVRPTEGSVHIGGRPITGPNRVGRIEKAELVQYVFQNPFGSLNPRRPVLSQVAEPLLAAGRTVGDARQQARQMLSDVGLSEAQSNRFPMTLSGGQCQRVGIARALIRQPKVVILDEPVSALDWSIRGEILEILDDLQAATAATYLFISHQQSLVERISDCIYEIADGTVHLRSHGRPQRRTDLVEASGASSLRPHDNPRTTIQE